MPFVPESRDEAILTMSTHLFGCRLVAGLVGGTGASASASASLSTNKTDDETPAISLVTAYKKMKSNPLRVRAGRSPIHNWGLFAMEPFQPHEMVRIDTLDVQLLIFLQSDC